MLHFLTSGYLDIAAAGECRIQVISPLDKAIIARLVGKYRDNIDSNEITFEGRQVLAEHGYVRCPWYIPKINLTSIRFILELQAVTSCVVADIEHGRVLSSNELAEFLTNKT